MGDTPSHYSLTARKVIFFAAMPLFALVSLGTIALIPFLWIYMAALTFAAKRAARRDPARRGPDTSRALPKRPIGNID